MFGVLRLRSRREDDQEDKELRSGRLSRVKDLKSAPKKQNKKRESTIAPVYSDGDKRKAKGKW